MKTIKKIELTDMPEHAQLTMEATHLSMKAQADRDMKEAGQLTCEEAMERDGVVYCNTCDGLRKKEHICFCFLCRALKKECKVCQEERGNDAA